ncbi:MAG: DUF4153 domain-containing protein [Erysipelotrichaceae bacterium]|nr:DUF4153 domain-containing protein [Erysipelotrichaceae bacterium]
MVSLLERIKKAGGRLEECIRRFPFSFLMLCLITADGIFLILAEKEAFELFFALVIGGLFAFLFELAYEYGIHRIRLLTPAVGLLSAAVTYLLLKNHDNVYVYTALTGACIACVSLIAFVLYRNRENCLVFSHLIKSAFIVWIFTGVILAGISVCIAAFHFLIFHFEEVWKIYAVLFLAISALFGVTLFLSYVPRPDEEISVPATYRTIIHKALFYIYLILIGILYLYIFKIIVTWKMPVGKLNWFGSFALLFYVVFYLSVDENDGKIQGLFKKYGACLLFPVLAIQVFAIAIRLHAYGLTTARLMSLILIAIAVGFMLSQMLGIRVSKCFLLIVVLALVFTCTPLNIYDIPNSAQESRLKNALSKGGALVNGVLDEDVSMEAEYLEDARSAYEYLRYSSGSKSSFFEDFSESKIAKSFNDYDGSDRKISSFYYSVDLQGKAFEIGEYGHMRFVSQEYEELDKELQPFFASLDRNKSGEQDDLLEYETADGNKIIFRYISFEFDEDNKEILYLYWEGILLSR